MIPVSEASFVHNQFWLYPLPLAFGILCVDEARKALVRSFPKRMVARIAP